MKLRSIVLALVPAVCLTLASAAHAQSGIFVTFDAQQFTQEGVHAIPPPGSSNVDRPWLFGSGYGIYYDVTRYPSFLFIKGGAIKTGPIAIGIEGRGDTLRRSLFGTQIDRQDGIFNLRFATKKQVMGTTPYVEAGFGVGHTRTIFRTHYSNNFIYQFGIGADKKLNKHIDWRVVEATAGSLANYATGYSPTGVGPNQSNYLVTVSTGLVFRIR